MAGMSRRTWLKAAGASAALPALSAPAATPAATNATPNAKPPGARFLTAPERACIEAAVARLVPNDDLGPGALEAGVADYIDAQLAGAWGAGERLYQSGPWQTGTPQQGYQLPLTPARLFRVALRGLDDELTQTKGSTFAKLAPADQDAVLADLEKSDRELGGVPARVFFDSLLAMTLEGYFGDPVYGGNRNMVSWRMIGFPGAYATYYDLVDQHGIAFTRAPMSLAENGAGQVHVHPQIPAYDPVPKKGR